MKVYIMCTPKAYTLHSRVIVKIKNPTMLYNFINVIMPAIPAIVDSIHVQIDRFKIG